MGRGSSDSEVILPTSALVVDRCMSGSYMFQLEYYNDTNHVVIGYLNVSSRLPVILTPSEIDIDTINLGEKSYIGGRLVIKDESYTVFHIEPCEKGCMYELDHCFYVITEERIIGGNRGEYGPPLFTADKSVEFDQYDEHEAFFMEPLSRSFGDALVRVNSEVLIISSPDEYCLVYDSRLSDEFCGYEKIEATKLMDDARDNHLSLSLETCQSIRTWLDSVL